MNYIRFNFTKKQLNLVKYNRLSSIAWSQIVIIIDCNGQISDHENRL